MSYHFLERELEDVEKVLVSVAQRLDKGMYPPDQVSTCRRCYHRRHVTHHVV